MPFDPQIYRLASIARDKLCREACRPSHNLRCLVAHANLLDDLLVELKAPKTEPSGPYGLPFSTEHTVRVATAELDMLSDRLSDEHEEDEGEEDLEAQVPWWWDLTHSSLPILSHDPESDSDSSSESDTDTDTDDDDDFATNSIPDSLPNTPHISQSPEDGEGLDLDDFGPPLHPAPGVRRFFGSSHADEPHKHRAGITSNTLYMESQPA